MAKLIWGSDLYKGLKLDKNALLGGNVNDILPFQMLTMEEKTVDWVKGVADFFETAGWFNVERKAGRIQQNYWMRYGKLNPNDYIVNPDINTFSQAVGWITPPNNPSPISQFYSIAPNFIEVLRGEFLKRDNRWGVKAIDQWSTAEAFEFKKQQFEAILIKQAQLEKQQALAQMGLTEESDPQQFQIQMEQMMQELTEVQLKAKNFRTVGEQWAEKVLKIHEERYSLYEIEPDGFESGLITDSEFWHIDLLDDDFKIELLNPKWCDYHKSPGIKYVSEGDYFLWFDFMSAGDIVNRYGRRMEEEDILKMKDIFSRSTSNILVVDQLKNRQDSYYDYTKPWSEATDLNPVLNDVHLGRELAYNFMRTPNFDHNLDVDILNPIYGRRMTAQPQMFRVMRLYWRSLKRIGWLTKINRDGTRVLPDWVDENFRVTIEPQYDTSVVKKETKDNLIYGEHIDWTWVPEWRHTLKISPNQKHTFWLNSQNVMESIYIDGGPTKFQFKGKNNPFDSLPPVEGCVYSHINTDAHSFIDRIKPLQIIYNICMNNVPKKFLKDYGNKIAIDKRLYSTNNLSNNVFNNDASDEYDPKDPTKIIRKAMPKLDPSEEYEEKLRTSDLLEYMPSRDTVDGMGQPALPTVLQLSTVQEAQYYFGLGQQIKWEAGELIGITRQRTGGQKASETAYSIQQGIQYSETQTEKYFEQHSNLMKRFRQRMLDAAQYYSTFKETSREVYMNEKDENVFLDIEGMENLLPHYNISLESKANVRAALQTISQFLQQENTLDILPSAKIATLIEGSVPKALELIKEGELKQQITLQAERDHEIQMEQERRKTALAQQQLQEQFTASESQKNRDSNVEIAQIKALGGVQTDVNKDLIPDAQQNLDNFFKQQEISNKKHIDQTSLDAKKEQELTKIITSREAAAADIEKEKIKQAGALAVAKQNKNKYDTKK